MEIKTFIQIGAFESTRTNQVPVLAAAAAEARQNAEKRQSKFKLVFALGAACSVGRLALASQSVSRVPEIVATRSSKLCSAALRCECAPRHRKRPFQRETRDALLAFRVRRPRPLH